LKYANNCAIICVIYYLITHMNDFFDAYGPAFLGQQLLRLNEVIDRGGARVLAQIPSHFPAQVASLLVLLEHKGPCNTTNLAREVGVSHQLISQRLRILQKQALITRVVDTSDMRRTLIRLTAKGRSAANEVEAACKAGEAAYRVLFEETGVDLFACVIKVRKALEERSLDLRIRDLSAVDPAAVKGGG